MKLKQQHITAQQMDEAVDPGLAVAASLTNYEMEWGKNKII